MVWRGATRARATPVRSVVRAAAATHPATKEATAATSGELSVRLSRGPVELIAAGACGCTVTDPPALVSSDRYAIRTRNLQDWNLMRYCRANRSKAKHKAKGHRAVQVMWS